MREVKRSVFWWAVVLVFSWSSHFASSAEDQFSDIVVFVNEKGQFFRGEEVVEGKKKKIVLRDLKEKMPLFLAKSQKMIKKGGKKAAVRLVAMGDAEVESLLAVSKHAEEFKIPKIGFIGENRAKKIQEDEVQPELPPVGFSVKNGSILIDSDYFPGSKHRLINLLWNPDGFRKVLTNASEQHKMLGGRGVWISMKADELMKPSEMKSILGAIQRAKISHVAWFKSIDEVESRVRVKFERKPAK